MEFYQIYLIGLYIALMVLVYAFVHMDAREKVWKHAAKLLVFIPGGWVFQLVYWLVTPVGRRT